MIHQNILAISADTTSVTDLLTCLHDSIWSNNIQLCAAITSTDIKHLNYQIYDMHLDYLAKHNKLNNVSFTRRAEQLINAKSANNCMTADIAFEIKNFDTICDIEHAMPSFNKSTDWIILQTCLTPYDTADLISAKINEPILSMNLYHDLKNNGYNTMLFTTYAVADMVNSAWRNHYKILFDDKDPVCILSTSPNCIRLTDTVNVTDIIKSTRPRLATDEL